MSEKEKTAETVEDLLWRFSKAEFDERSWTLRVEDREVDLEPRPLEILAYLLRHAGEVVTKEELLDEVWGRSSETISDKVLTNAVGKLRRALGDEQDAIIATVHRRGYRLVAAVSRVVVGRRVLPQLALNPGDAVPHRPQWRLLEAIDTTARAEVWLGEHAKTRERRVFKFSPDAARLSSLKREVTLSRVLRESLGDRSEFVRVLEWNFEEAPYFIECEYGGRDWNKWAEAQGGLGAVPLEQRLSLFVSAAAAIGAAHGVGVLHKDIKPANLLVMETGEAAPQVRVTDFGSGRLLAPGRLEQLGITQLGFTQTQALSGDSLTGTALYLAPELLAGQAPTQASDVYALGVLLYQLVVADFRRPLSSGWEREIAEELLQEDIAIAAAGDASLRLDSARALAQRVAQLPTRRVERAAAIRQRESALEAAAVLQRARQRRPWVLAAGMALTVGLGFSIYFQVQAKHQAQRAWAINRFLQDDVIGAANPSRSGRTNVTVLEALQSAEPNIDLHLADQPALAAEVRLNLAHAYQNLNAHERALPLISLALKQLQSAGQPPESDVLESLLYIGIAGLGQGAEARAHAARLGDEVLPKLPDSAYFRGFAAFYRGQQAQFENDWKTVRRQALSVQRHWPDDPRGDHLLIRAHRHLGSWSEAEALEARLLSRLEQEHRKHPEDMAIAVQWLDIRQQALRDTVALNRLSRAQAQPLWHELDAAMGKTLGADHPMAGHHRAWGAAMGFLSNESATARSPKSTPQGS